MPTGVGTRVMRASVTERIDRLIISGLLGPEQVQEPLWQLLLTVPEAAALDALTEFAARQRDSPVSSRVSVRFPFALLADEPMTTQRSSVRSGCPCRDPLRRIVPVLSARTPAGTHDGGGKRRLNRAASSSPNASRCRAFCRHTPLYVLLLRRSRRCRNQPGRQARQGPGCVLAFGQRGGGFGSLFAKAPSRARCIACAGCARAAPATAGRASSHTCQPGNPALRYLTL